MKYLLPAILIVLISAFVGAPAKNIVLVRDGTVPVFRFWNKNTGAHFYTIDEAEKVKLETLYVHIWIYEGVAYYVYPPLATGNNGEK